MEKDKKGYKVPIIISVVSLCISILSLSHDVIVKEYGLIIGNKKYTIFPSEKVKIRNSVCGLSVAPVIDISNDGTVPIRINKVKAYIKYNNSHHVFETLDTISIDPGQKYKGDVWLDEDYPDSERMDKDKLDLEILHDLMSSYHARAQNYDYKTNSSPIFLSEKIYKVVRGNLTKQVDWMKSDDDYYLLLMLWFDAEQKEPDVKILYQFSLNDYQLKIISDYQIDGLKTPNKIPGNVSSVFNAWPRITYVTDIEKIANVYDSYKRYAVKIN